MGKEIYYPIEEEVPYDLKEAVRRAGGYIIPVQERQKVSGLWVVNSERKREKIKKMIDDYHKGIDDNTEGVNGDLPAAGELPKDKSTKEAYFAIPDEQIKTVGEYDWTQLLSEDGKGWDSLKAVQAIKGYGLPQDVHMRELLLRRLKNKDRGEQYNVVYEDLCEYSEAFRMAYGDDTVRKALETADITDGFNLEKNVKNSDKISEEVKNLLLYVFPIVRRAPEEPEAEFSI